MAVLAVLFMVVLGVGAIVAVAVAVNDGNAADTDKSADPAEPDRFVAEGSDGAVGAEETAEVGPTAEVGSAATTTVTAIDPEPSLNAAGLLSEEDVAALVAEARELLAGLDIADLLAAPVPYNRDDYDGDGWGDADGDCINHRNEVLIVESTIDPVLDGCRVVAGQWTDWMSGEKLNSPGVATIDHVVPLGHAHQAGAWAWSPETKHAFANDISEAATLNVASGPSNQAKGADAPDRWRPPSTDAWCGYATSWIRVKARWDLSVTPAEVAVLGEMLGTCGVSITLGVGVDQTAARVQPASVVIALPTPTTPPPTPAPGSAATLTISGCDARGEMVTIANPTADAISLAEWRLHDEGVKHTFVFPGVTIEPGRSRRVLTGDAFVEGDDLFWKDQNVWNNDGDHAFLINADGVTVSDRRC